MLQSTDLCNDELQKPLACPLTPTLRPQTPTYITDVRMTVVEGKRCWPAAPAHNLPRVRYHEVFLETPGKNGLPHAPAVPKRHVRPEFVTQE